MKQLNEVTRMQQLAGLNEIKVNNPNQIKSYYDDIIKIGGGDLAGSFEDVLSSVEEAGSFQRFLAIELEFANEEGDEDWIKIIQKYI